MQGNGVLYVMDNFLLHLQMSFLQPDADLAAVVPVAVAIFIPPPLMVALAVHYILKYRRNELKGQYEQTAVEEDMGNAELKSFDSALNSGAEVSFSVQPTEK